MAPTAGLLHVSSKHVDSKLSSLFASSVSTVLVNAGYEFAAVLTLTRLDLYSSPRRAVLSRKDPQE
jgi:hypothetical protein